MRRPRPRRVAGEHRGLAALEQVVAGDAGMAPALGLGRHLSAPEGWARRREFAARPLAEAGDLQIFWGGGELQQPSRRRRAVHAIRRRTASAGSPPRRAATSNSRARSRPAPAAQALSQRGTPLPPFLSRVISPRRLARATGNRRVRQDGRIPSPRGNLTLGQGGKGMSGRLYGRAMATTGPSIRDGLQLDRTDLPLGPVLALASSGGSTPVLSRPCDSALSTALTTRCTSASMHVISTRYTFGLLRKFLPR